MDPSLFGHLQYHSKTKQGSFAEYITVPESDLALVPPTITMEMAAACTTETLTALQAIQDKEHLKKRDSILIIGAGGGVGSAAVGIAKALGPQHVRTICSTKDLSHFKEMGADLTIDRKKDDPTTELTDKFHVVFDTPSK